MSKIVTVMILDTEALTEWKRTTIYEDDSGNGFSTDDYRSMLANTYDKLIGKFNQIADVDCILCDCSDDQDEG